MVYPDSIFVMLNLILGAKFKTANSVNGDIKRLERLVKTNDSQDHDTIHRYIFCLGSIFLGQLPSFATLVCAFQTNTNFSFEETFEMWQLPGPGSVSPPQKNAPNNTWNAWPNFGGLYGFQTGLLRERVVTSPLLNRLLVDSKFKVGWRKLWVEWHLWHLWCFDWKSAMFCFYLCGPADSLHGFIVADARMTFIIRHNWQQRGNQETHDIRFDMFIEANSQHHQP